MHVNFLGYNIKTMRHNKIINTPRKTNPSDEGYYNSSVLIFSAGSGA